MITLNINVTKIDKGLLYEGKNGGKYLGLALFDNKEGIDQYGNNGFVVQDVGKDKRLAGERGPIVGNWREVGGAKAAPKPETPKLTDEAEDDIPF